MLMDEGYEKLIKYEVNSIKFIRLYEYLYTYTKSEVFSTPFFGVVNPSATVPRIHGNDLADLKNQTLVLYRLN